MIVKSLKLANYRNIDSLQFDPADGINLFYGENGSGKTNLLESIFMLCLGRSQRGAPDSMVLQSGREFYRLEGELQNNTRVRTVAVAYEKRGRKRISIDGVKSRVSELFDHFCAVAAGPEDNLIIAGSPSARRLFLDMYLSQVSQTYLSKLGDYQKALAQKNSALKQRMGSDTFDDLLVRYGCDLIAARRKFVRSLASYANSCYADIAGGESLEITYRSSVPLGEESDEGVFSQSALEDSFRKELYDKKERELSVRVALVGPHRDDIGVEIGGFPARTHGSQGQWRTAAIALKLGVYSLLKQERGHPPVLLLDEIFAELDSRRTLQLMHMFDGFSQLFITMAAQPPAGMRETARCYRVAAGKIQEVV